MAHSLVLNNVLEPGSPDKHLRALSHSCTCPLPSLSLSLTHKQFSTHLPPAKIIAQRALFSSREVAEGWVVCQAAPELALGTAFWGQSTFELKITLAWAQHPGGLISMPITPCPPLQSGRRDGRCPWTARQPWWLPSPGVLQKSDLVPAKARHQARLWSVDLNDIFDGPPADRAASPGLPLEPQATAVAQAHMSTRVDDRVHFAIEAHRALAILAARWLWWGEHGRHRGAQRGAGGRHQG